MPRQLILALAAGLAVIAAYAWRVEPGRLEVTEHVIAAGPQSDRPIRVVQLSDLHLQSVGDREREVAAQVARLKPDLVVLSGDVVDRADTLGALDTFLSLLGTSRKVAVLGNWEYWSEVDLEALRTLYEKRHNTALLINQTVTFQFDERPLQVIGLDDFTAGKPDTDSLTGAGGGVVSIVVQHSPGWFDTSAASTINRRFALCLSGHTHGGQVTIFGFAVWRPRGSGRFTAGLYDAKICPLYVSRGIGTSILPVRFGARPEIAVFSL